MKLISFVKEVQMQKTILGVFLTLLLLPSSQAFSQEFSDNAPTLSVSFASEIPYLYKDSEGHTVAVGIVENNNSLTPITNVRIQVSFFDNFSNTPIEVIEGNSILEVISSNGQSPYVIRSQNIDSNITHASISLLGFDSSVVKQKRLTVFPSEVLLDGSFSFSGILRNGGAPSSNTNVHLAFYDSFDPPRILSVSTVEIGSVLPNTQVNFDINEKIDSRSVGFLLFAESNIFSSDSVDVKIPPPPQLLTKLAKINNVSIKDNLGNNLSEIKIGSPVRIESETLVQFSADQNTNETPYTYYVQVKESGKVPFVEFIGKYEGRFIGTGSQSQTVDWVPEKEGLYFVETFVWDRNNVPIAERGPVAIILIN
ncbi:MAG: hypothetical protein ACR2LL_12775 [Nitrosopumilus sp.]